MKFRTLFMLILTLSVSELASSNEIKPPPSPTSDTAKSPPEPRSTLGDIHSFELALPLAADVNFVHSSRAKAVTLAPSLSYFLGKIEIGLRAPVNYKNHRLEGAGLFFVNFYPAWQPEAKRTYFLGLQSGWNYFSGRDSFRIGPSLGEVFAIGKVSTPGLVRVALNFHYDSGGSGKSQLILGLNAEVSVPL